jgi:rhodanese-related sulfurtransferase
MAALVGLLSAQTALADKHAATAPGAAAAPAAAAATNTPSAPMQATGVKVISAAELKEKVDKKSCTVVDVRAALEYSEEHIPTAVNVPYKEKSDKNVKEPEKFDDKIDRFDMAKLPASKTDALCFYCRGDKCWASYKAALVAKKSGRPNIFWMRDGMPGWKSQNYATEKMSSN